MSARAGLNALKIKTMKDPGYYADGGGLYLQVKSESSKTWVFRFTSPVTSRRRDMGLGPVQDIPLADARTRARDLRLLIQDGKDPIEVRDAELRTQSLQAASAKTFEQCAKEYMEEHRDGWSPKQRQIWESSLKTYAYPVIGHLLASEIRREMILQILRPLMKDKTETGKKLQNRLARIMGWARSLGYCQGENPAEWKDNLDHALKSLLKNAKVSNMPSMPREDLPEFYAELSALPDRSRMALQFLILTVTRNRETREATWSEIDWENRLWIIPKDRMKAAREHRVPLSGPALEILRTMRSMSLNRYVFPGRIGGRPISEMTVLQLMRRLGRTEVPHGFRSTFKDWAAECTNYPNEASEMALAHAVSDKVEAAYRRGDLLEKRRQMMEDWASFVTGALGGSMNRAR